MNNYRNGVRKWHNLTTLKKSDSVNLNVKCVCLLLTKHVCSNTLLKQQHEDTNIRFVIFLRYEKSKNISL